MNKLHIHECMCTPCSAAECQRASVRKWVCCHKTVTFKFQVWIIAMFVTLITQSMGGGELLKIKPSSSDCIRPKSNYNLPWQRSWGSSFRTAGAVQPVFQPNLHQCTNEHGVEFWVVFVGVCGIPAEYCIFVMCIWMGMGQDLSHDGCYRGVYGIRDFDFVGCYCWKQ